MTNFTPRALHLHTLDSLLADLVSGRGVQIGDNEVFKLEDERARSALDWLRKRGPVNWAKGVTGADAEALITGTLATPPVLAMAMAQPTKDTGRRLTLKRLEAHRFAGLHEYGTPEAAPDNYVFEFSSAFTLFEGRNGSGKTSLLNAIIWALTGQILRPQRKPEATNIEFDLLVEAEDDSRQGVTYRQTPVTPLVDVSIYRPEKDWVPADTWVELTFEDEKGTRLPAMRRIQQRTKLGKLEEISPDFSTLNVDPISLQIGTVMPGQLPLIQVGSESELGKAVAQLTGLSSLNDVSDYARRAKKKIDAELLKELTKQQGEIDRAYSIIRSDLEKKLAANPAIKPSLEVPTPSDDPSIEGSLTQISAHFESVKASAFGAAVAILGENFDASQPSQRSNLERNIGPALSEISQIARQPSVHRLAGLGAVQIADLDAAIEKIRLLESDAKALSDLAKNPTAAARIRLYAKIASWLREHPDPERNLDLCLLCGGSISASIDPITGKSVRIHLHEATSGSESLSQTINAWAKAASAELARHLPSALREELDRELPDHPSNLIRSTIVDELFDLEPFAGTLAALRDATAESLDIALSHGKPLDAPLVIELPLECRELALALNRLEKAVRFARWRSSNQEFVTRVSSQILGKKPKDGDAPDIKTLAGKLLSLQATVKSAEPLNEALALCGRLATTLTSRRANVKRTMNHTVASNALGPLLTLGDLADKQVEQLRIKLRKDAAAWRERIYLGAFPSTARKLADARMGRNGELELLVAGDGVSAPAQHVTNASALRATLVGFYLAFWEHVLNTRGGITLMALDDPQELLDNENRERLAQALSLVVKAGAQLVVTSHDSRFSNRAAHLKGIGEVDHRWVHPATKGSPTIVTSFHSTEISKRKVQFANTPDDEEAARNFADACRVYLEAKLSDVFEDPAFSAWVKENQHPTLKTYVDRLRMHSNPGPSALFAHPIFKWFTNHPSLADDTPLVQLMNKSHHGQRHEIRAADVQQCADDLMDLIDIAEQMFEECTRWRRRDLAPTTIAELPKPLPAMAAPHLSAPIWPDLAAFTQQASAEETQEEIEHLKADLLAEKNCFQLRRDNFGFAAPAGALAIVENQPTPGKDRNLVVARTAKGTLARRLVTSAESDIVGLTADIPDPTQRPIKTSLMRREEVALHEVIGVLFEHGIALTKGNDEAVLVDVHKEFQQIEAAFRVIDDSAVPLALKGQLVLGGRQIPLSEIGQYQNRLVAASLTSGAGVFKRVGKALPGDLSHLRQFESVGGLGSSVILSVGRKHEGVQQLQSARLIIGVLYRS